jgi:hypothetical protein
MKMLHFDELTKEHEELKCSHVDLVLLGVCFIAEDPKRGKHLRQILSEAAPKLSPVELRHSDKSQDEGGEPT